MPRFLDTERWPRKAAFEFFRRYDNPYFNVCAPLDATPLVELSRSARDVPFSLACVHLALGAANEYEPFRYRLDAGRVLVHDVLHAATTTLLEEDRLAFIYFDYDDDFTVFRQNADVARQALGGGSGEMDVRDDRTDLIHFSSIPWIAFTSISHPRTWRREDSVPKITFGKYHEAGDRMSLPVSVEVHHGLMDGVHVGRFFERLQGRFAEPAAALGLTRITAQGES
jgi:chloramphenicol O-acetyltransferase type A